MARPANRAYHHGDLKRALVEESVALLESEGADALTVAAVGRRIGVSSAAPYRHFEDRRALLRAVAHEGNRRLNEALGDAARTCADPTEAFRQAGIAYVRWAAEHPALYRLVSDPSLLDYGAPPEGELPEGVDESMETFWPDLAALVRSGDPMPADHPLIRQLHGRALARGLASFFEGGIFDAIGIRTSDAERLTRAVTGEDVPGTKGRKARRR